MGTPLSTEDLYEQARSGGLSHRTATQVLEAPRVGRGPLSGDWPRMPSDVTPVVANGYAGPSPSQESLLWLSLCAKGLRSEWLTRQLIRNQLPLVVNTRVNCFGGWKDGAVWLDMHLRHLGGGDEFKSLRIPIEACLAHDTTAVLKRALASLSMRSVSLIQSTLLSETSLRHVAG